MKHTSLPWRLDGLQVCAVEGAFTKVVAEVDPFDVFIKPVSEANAEFIVTACNNYYNLMELLDVAKSMLADAHDRDECYDEITGEMFDDFKALTEAIDKCEGRGK